MYQYLGIIHNCRLSTLIVDIRLFLDQKIGKRKLRTFLQMVRIYSKDKENVWKTIIPPFKAEKGTDIRILDGKVIRRRR